VSARGGVALAIVVLAGPRAATVDLTLTIARRKVIQ
jgi:hypothetical protein